MPPPGPTRRVADELERRGGRAQARGGVAAAAAFLAAGGRADLRPGAARCAGAGRRAGEVRRRRPGRRRSSCSRSREITPLDELQRARLGRLRARITFVAHARQRRARRCCSTPRSASSRSMPGWPARPISRRSGGDLRRPSRQWPRSAGRGRVGPPAPPRPRPPRAIDLLLDGLATRFTDGYAAGVAPLRRALERSRARMPPRSRTTCAGCGWRAPSRPSRWRPSSGTTRPGTTLAARAVTLGSRLRRARAAAASPSPIARSSMSMPASSTRPRR